MLQTVQYNKNGDIICNGSNCRKHKQLFYKDTFNGVGQLIKLPYCEFHFNNPEQIKMKIDKINKSITRYLYDRSEYFYNYSLNDQSIIYSTTNLAIYNKKGNRLCDAYGCFRHKEVSPFAGGLFCRKHIQILSDIRQRINDHNGSTDEFEARQEEILFRKRFDSNHVNYAYKLNYTDLINDLKED